MIKKQINSGHKLIMKRLSLVAFLILGIGVTIFSQRAVLEMNVPKLEKEAISRMRKVFKVSKQTEFFATIVFGTTNTDTMGTRYLLTDFDISQKIGRYINMLKIEPNTYDYEIFVYDRDLKYLYVVNRLYYGVTRYPKKYHYLYLGRKTDYPLFKFLAARKYDFVYIVREIPFSEAEVLLCFKNGLIDLAYLKDEQWHSTPVCSSDDFSFLQPLLDERLKELEIVKERIRKEKQE